MASGDTLELKIQHPTAGSRDLFVQSDQDITLDPGGYTGERQNNGNLTGHKKMTAKSWEIAGLQIEFSPGDGTIEFLQAVSNSPDDAVVTWQHITGVVYVGSGSIEGDIKPNTNSGYIPLTLTGNGKLEPIA